MSGVTITRGLAASLLLLVFVGCNEDEALFVVCPEVCYTGPVGTENIGICKFGTPTCDEEGNILSCDGEVTPLSRELCNARDDDCDGEVDEYLTISPWEDDNTCQQCGKCSQTRERCDPNTGTWYCDYQQGHPSATDATCDGEDDDCDCQTDEDAYADGEIVFCYDGPDGTVTHGECRPGVEECVNGRVVCDGQVLPRAETCNGLDDDCNGWSDDVTDVYQGIDLIFGIDTSGSMGEFIEAVESVVCDYAEATEGRADLSTRMGLVLIATPDGEYSLAENLTDAQTLCETLGEIQLAGGSEPTLSAAEAVADPTNPLMIDWTPGSKRIFIGFGDENGQVHCPDSGGELTLPCDPDEAVINTLAYCTESGTDIYWFVGGSLEFYMEQALGCNGALFQLTSYEQWMMDDLNSILEEVCLETDAP